MTQAVMNPTDELRARKVELVLQQLDSLPTLPAVAVRLLTLTGNPEAKIREVTELIALDPSLTSKILKLVQSAATGVRNPITSVQQAVVLIGFDTLRNLVLSLKVFEVFQHDVSAGEHKAFDRQEFWKHSLAVATAAEMLAAHTRGKVNVHDAFTCGLLHDLGKVAFHTAMPKSFDRVVEVATLTRGDIADAERRVIGLDHTVAGKRLAEAWNLPQMITQAIWLHGSAPMSMPAGIQNPALIQIIGLADLIARRQHIGFSGNFLYPFDSKQYLTPLNISEGDLLAITDSLAEELEKKAKALGLYDVESRQIYLESIANANIELGRVNQVLQIQNRKLALRSSCFELLTDFVGRVVPAASPAQLLVEIGNVMHPFLRAQKLVLFSQDTDQNMGEVLTYDVATAAHESFLMQMPKYAGDQRVGRASTAADFVRPAVPQLDWLLERMQGFLGARRCLFMPLLSGTEPVGGILWAAPEDTRYLSEITDLPLVSQHLGMTLRMMQVREQQNVLTEALAGANRELAGLQDQIVRAKSLAELGEMAAGAAHEMNNPLAVVCGRAQLLASKLTDPALKQDATLIATQGERLSQMITDLMEYAKPNPPRFAQVSMEPLVREAIAEAAGRAGADHKAAVRFDGASDVPNIHADAKQLRHALAEILLNAIQASKVESGAVPPEILVHVRHDPLDHQVIVQVMDRGMGMSEEIMRQAFAPFFSAKSAGRRRGMGLAKAMRWVEAHGGTIRLDSEENRGTTVVVILPERTGGSSK